MIAICPNCEEEVEIKHGYCPNCGDEFHRQEKVVKLDEWEETNEWTDTAFDRDL